MAGTENYLGWLSVEEGEKPILHVVPNNDTMTHCYDNCWCQPFLDGDSVVHNSADHREDYLEYGRKVN